MVHSILAAGPQASRCNYRRKTGTQYYFAVSRPVSREMAGPLSEVLNHARIEQSAIPSRWQHDAVPPWRPVPPRLVCEVRVTNLDLLVAELHKFVCNSIGCVSLTVSPGKTNAGTRSANVGEVLACSAQGREHKSLDNLSHLPRRQSGAAPSRYVLKQWERELLVTIRDCLVDSVVGLDVIL